MQLTIHTTSSAPDAARPVLDDIRDAVGLGVVPNLAASIAASPALLGGFDGLRRSVATIDPVRREVAGLAVGVAVDNRYGVAWHTRVLRLLGVAEDEIDRIRTGTSPTDPVLAAVHDLARAIVLQRGAVDADLVERVRSAGLGEGEILDVVAECAFASLVGLVDNLGGHLALDEFLRPHEWTPDRPGVGADA